MAKKANTIGLGEYTDNDLITELENRNVVPKLHSARIAFGDFSMRHTLRCSKDDMRTCIYHQWLNDKYMDNQGMSPFSPAGEYALTMDANGEMNMTLIKEDKETI